MIASLSFQSNQRRTLLQALGCLPISALGRPSQILGQFRAYPGEREILDWVLIMMAIPPSQRSRFIQVGSRPQGVFHSQGSGTGDLQPFSCPFLQDQLAKFIAPTSCKEIEYWIGLLCKPQS